MSFEEKFNKKVGKVEPELTPQHQQMSDELMDNMHLKMLERMGADPAIFPDKEHEDEQDLPMRVYAHGIDELALDRMAQEICDEIDAEILNTLKDEFPEVPAVNVPIGTAYHDTHINGTVIWNGEEWTLLNDPTMSAFNGMPEHVQLNDGMVAQKARIVPDFNNVVFMPDNGVSVPMKILMDGAWDEESDSDALSTAELLAAYDDAMKGVGDD